MKLPPQDDKTDDGTSDYVVCWEDGFAPYIAWYDHGTRGRPAGWEHATQFRKPNPVAWAPLPKRPRTGKTRK